MRRRTRAAAWTLLLLVLGACQGQGSGVAAGAVQALDSVSDATFVALVARVSEPGGYFDTDNLISNEAGYLKVVGALERAGTRGGAYVGVGPDQNYSYIAALQPEVAFITDIRRDNLLHHLLLKALVERSPTRVEFLCALHGHRPPEAPGAWVGRSAEDILTWMEEQDADAAYRAELQAQVLEAVAALEVPLSDDDLATIRRFHSAFIDAGPALRFTSFGRPPRPHYPTYRQLVLETDLEGRPVSYLADAGRYGVVRALHLTNRIVPVVGDMAGDKALREMGAVMGEMGVALTAFYTSNVEFYLFREGTFQAWMENLASMPVADDAVIIRSYFPNFGRPHPSAVPGYFATQSLQPAAELLRGGFGSYWEVVTRGVLPLR